MLKLVVWEKKIYLLTIHWKTIKLIDIKGDVELDGGNKSAVGVAAQNEQLALVKRILFKSDADSKSSGSGGVGVGHSSSLIHCLFVHIASDSRSSIDFLMQELYFKFVQNDAFNKSERIRLFNDRTLSHLIKLYSWKEEASEESELEKN